MGRATQGVKLINLEKRNDEIASVCKVISEKDEEVASAGGEESELNVQSSIPFDEYAADTVAGDDDIEGDDIENDNDDEEQTEE